MAGMPLKECGHVPSDHDRLRKEAETLIAQERDALGLEAPWSICVMILSPLHLPLYEGTISWDAEVWYATMQLRCDLPPALLHWVVQHELIELWNWRSTSLLFEILDTARTGLIQAYRGTRPRQLAEMQAQLERLETAYVRVHNQEVEQLLCLKTRHRRPARLTPASELFSSAILP